MPTFTTSRFPPTQDSNEFESITKDALSERYCGLNFDKYGRSGQAQYGIDLIAKLPNSGHIVCQCKNTTELTIDMIKSEVEKSSDFPDNIFKFYFASRLERDRKLQDQVIQYNQQYSASNGFYVTLFFWDDITSELSKNQNLIQKHFPQYFQTMQGSVAKLNDIRRVTNLFEFIDMQGLLSYFERIDIVQCDFYDYYDRAKIILTDPTFTISDQALFSQLLSWWIAFDELYETSIHKYSPIGLNQDRLKFDGLRLDIFKSKEDEQAFQIITDNFLKLKAEHNKLCQFIGHQYPDVPLDVLSQEARSFQKQNHV